MNLVRKQSGFLNKGLTKLVACFIVTASLSIGHSRAAENSVASTTAVTQQRSIALSGRVTDEKGNALIGVTVAEKGTSRGVSTDTNGNYKINVSNTNAVLIFSYIGYITQEQAVGNKTQISVNLKENVKMFDEVIVIGYGTQRKGDVTSAVASVKKEDFTIGKIGDAAELVFCNIEYS